MSEIHILQKFKNQLILFLDELIGQFPTEGDLIVFRIFIKDQIPVITIMDNCRTFIEKDPSVREKITTRDENFFVDGKSNFLNFSSKKDKINHFKKLWRSNVLDDENKKVIWQWIDSLVILMDKYTKIVTPQVQSSKDEGSSHLD